MKILIKGGKVIDPGQGIAEVRDILLEDGFITGLAPVGRISGLDEAVTIDASGLWVTPGLIDMHVHLREPGQEHKETIASGTAAAAAGGFSAVAAMANTSPVGDNPSTIDYIIKKSEASGRARVYPLAAMTRSLGGDELCDFGALAKAGAIGVSDDGRWVADSRVMRRILESARDYNLAVISHAEDMNLARGGAMNEGRISAELGLPGIPAAAEEIAVFRDVRLAQLTGTHLHLAHISTAGAVEIIRRAKEKGLPVTAETAPHYFTLTEESVRDFGTAAKMNPPLRTGDDLQAVIDGLADGTIEVIATDHAPHSNPEKDLDFQKAAFGIVGLETALPLSLDLVRRGIFSPLQAIAALSLNPARILGVRGGTLKPGSPADLALIDPAREWVVKAVEFKSRGRNTPFEGRKMTGRAVMTIRGGKITHNLLEPV